MNRSRVRDLFKGLAARLDNPKFFDRLLLTAIVVGVALRFVTLFTLLPRYDATAYMAEGNSLAQGRGFLAPWGGYDNPLSSGPEPTRLGPIYPLWLALFYLVFGFSIEATQAAALVLAFATLVVSYLATADLYGRRTALLTCAFLAANPWLVVFPGMEWSDNMPLLFFIVALWGLVRGMRSGSPVHFSVAGVAVAAYALTKAQGLSPILIALAAGGFVAWRALERGRGVVRDVPTWAFAVSFLAPLLVWIVWGPNSSPPGALFEPNAVQIGGAAGIKLILVVFSLGFVLAFLVPEIVRARSTWMSEEGRLLWLAGIGLVVLVWGLLVAAFASGTTPWDPLWKPEQARHLAPAIVPLTWLARSASGTYGKHSLLELLSARRTRWIISGTLVLGVPVAAWLGTFTDGLFLLFFAAAIHVRQTNVRIVIAIVLALLVATNGALEVVRSPEIQAGEWLRTNGVSGQVVAIDPWFGFANGTAIPGPSYKYELYPYISGRGLQAVPYQSGVNASYIFSYRADNYSGYQLVATFYWESRPGPLSWLWNHAVAFGRTMVHGEEPPKGSVSGVWLLERIP